VPPYDPRYLQGIACFNRQDYFEAHEVWEDLWNDEHGEAKQFCQGLIQAAVALHHLERGNLAGAEKLLARSRLHLEPYRPHYRGLDVEAFLRAISWCVERPCHQRGEPPRIHLKQG